MRDLKNEISKILIIQCGGDPVKTCEKLEALFNEHLTEQLRDDRKAKASALCPMCCMTYLESNVEVGTSDEFHGEATCSFCHRQFCIHGERSFKVTRIIPKEDPCTGSQQLRLSGI